MNTLKREVSLIELLSIDNTFILNKQPVILIAFQSQICIEMYPLHHSNYVKGYIDSIEFKQRYHHIYVNIDLENYNFYYNSESVPMKLDSFIKIFQPIINILSFTDIKWNLDFITRSRFDFIFPHMKQVTVSNKIIALFHIINQLNQLYVYSLFIHDILISFESSILNIILIREIRDMDAKMDDCGPLNKFTFPFNIFLTNFLQHKQSQSFHDDFKAYGYKKVIKGISIIDIITLQELLKLIKY